MKAIVTEFGKFIYNRLCMIMCTSGDIFQAEVDKLLGDILVVNKYINYIPNLSKNILEKHIGQMIIIFGRLRAAGVEVDAPK